MHLDPDFDHLTYGDCRERAKQIMKLGDDEVKVKLALSLLAPTDAKRNEIMPINETNNIKTLITIFCDIL